MQQQAANIIIGITGPGDGFTLKWGWFRFRLRIKLISAERLVKISREICQINDTYEESGSFFYALMEHASDTRFICRAIAISTGTPFVGIVSRAISKLPLKDVQTLFKIVQSKSDAEVFFYTMASAKKLNLMKKVKAE